MSKHYVNDGRTVNVTAGSAISAGDVVVVGALLGVAITDIAAGATGAVAVSGVFSIPAVTGAAFTQGRDITWDVSASLADDHDATAASGDLTGGCIAMETIASAAAGSRVKVALNVGVNTIT